MCNGKAGGLVCGLYHVGAWPRILRLAGNRIIRTILALYCVFGYNQITSVGIVRYGKQ